MLEKFLIFMIISGVAGWWTTRKMRKRMERRLGREIKGEHELTSLTSWMEAESKDKR